MFETSRGPISLLVCFHFDNEIIQYVHFKCKNRCFKLKCLRHWGDLFHFYVFILTMKLFNMLILSVQTGMLSLNVLNIEGTYFTSSIFSFWQSEIIQYVYFKCKCGILSLNFWNIEGTYFTSSVFSFWQCEIIQYVHFNCKNWYFKFKCLKHKRGPISLLAYFHFDNVILSFQV